MTTNHDGQAPVHIHFVLDRSGSMDAIRSDVIGGFNSFLHEQQVNGGACVMTLVQFDDQDPYEVVADAIPVAELTPLSESTFVPRGTTPLYDAMGHAVANATIRAERREAAGDPAEDILFVTFTDGMENASREYDRAKVFDLVKRREAQGWTFAYLGANQDAYAESGKVGMAKGSTAAWAASPTGTAEAFGNLSRATTAYRAKPAQARQADKDDFFDES